MENPIPERIHLNGEWQIHSQLAEGGFGRVYNATGTNGESAVAKFIPQDPGADRELLFQELTGLPNIVPILDTGEWDSFWVLVMPKAEKSLRTYLEENIGILTLESALKVLVDIVEALVAMEETVVHRDIKPENILLLNGKWCLSDFGISRYAEATTANDTRKFYMTRAYAAPEQWRQARATTATDVYSLGVVAYEILAGSLPFIGPADNDYRRQHLEEVPGPINGVPPLVQSMIDECLLKPPEARPRPSNLLVRLPKAILPSTEAGRRLQSANASVVRQQAEEARKQSVARLEEERRNELAHAADSLLTSVVWSLNEQITANAPTVGITDRTLSTSWSLSGAELTVSGSNMCEVSSDANSEGPPFEIVAYASIALRLSSASPDYLGRSHSLWYCDAKEPGVFRWYETAFMISPFVPQTSRLKPFSMDPCEDAFLALSVVHTIQVAWPFIPFDQGEEGEFIERWIGWFADAAEGQLQSPTTMPERYPRDSWRKKA